MSLSPRSKRKGLLFAHHSPNEPYAEWAPCEYCAWILFMVVRSKSIGDEKSRRRSFRFPSRSCRRVITGLPQYLRPERPEFSARRRLLTSDRTKPLVLEFQPLPKEDSVLWSSARSSCNLAMSAAGEIEKKGPNAKFAHKANFVIVER